MSDKLNVVLYWHMHQPEYRDLRNGEYHQPWTYLHSIKDYVDMAAHLEAVPQAKAVINFAPILLEQIEDYREQLDGFLFHGNALRDPLLSALADEVLPEDQDKRIALIHSCMKANEQRLIHRFKPFRQLVVMAKQFLKKPANLDYLSDQFLVDLLVWYHLAWLGETVRRYDQRAKTLIKKKRLYNSHDRRLLVEIIYDIHRHLLDRYRALANQGRIELSMTPYAHPIIPLLHDFQTGREAVPDMVLPESSGYPDGYHRAEWHMQKGLESFKRIFGFTPQGCWPSEGSISEGTVNLLAEQGIRWLASGETVLRNSMHKSGLDSHGCIHMSYQFQEQPIRCFFRDDGLSDHIGFKYADWHADDAVANLIHNLQNIATACTNHPEAIVSIILDGENAWEYYPENGFYFLSALYQQLSQHEDIELTTYSQYLDQHESSIRLNHIVAGSWVYGSLTTWIGDKDKNRAWDMLVDAKQAYDRVMSESRLSEEDRQRAEMQLAICEGSDWFWWFGDYNPAGSVSAFDEQYRLHLCNLYHLLGESAPEYLSHAFSLGSGEPAMGGVMLPGQLQES